MRAYMNLNTWFLYDDENTELLWNQARIHTLFVSGSILPSTSRDRWSLDSAQKYTIC